MERDATLVVIDTSRVDDPLNHSALSIRNLPVEYLQTASLWVTPEAESVA